MSDRWTDTERQRERSRLMDMVQRSLVSSHSGEGRKAVCGSVVKMSQTLYVLLRYKHLDCVGGSEQREAERLLWKEHTPATPSFSAALRPRRSSGHLSASNLYCLAVRCHKRQTLTFLTVFICLLLTNQINSRRPWPVRSSHNH